MFSILRRSPLLPFAILAVVAVLIGVVMVLLAIRTPEARRQASRAVAVSEERCWDCHRGMTGFSPYHNPAALGCVACHAGHPTDTTEAGAHAGMIRVPGTLHVARSTCGEEGCHPGLVTRVEGSLMATGRGIVAVDRFVFGEQPTPNGTDGLADLQDSHADTHLKQLCASCHLGHDKAAPGPVTELSRGGGCVACHVQYTLPRGPKTHPALTIAVTDDHCFGCHSRSGRISTNYAGWHETVLAAEEVAAKDTTYRILDDGRVFARKPQDAHHALGLACIDCHTARETMGDGVRYRHQDEQVEITCSACHVDTPPPTLGWADLDEESQKIVLLRVGRALPERRFAQTKRGRALTNVFLDPEDGLVLEGKLNNRRYALPKPTAACARAGHERVSCQSCHSAWAPQCLGCHTQQGPDGQWLEFVADFLADAPTLGVREDTVAGRSRIEPFAPGMIMTLNTHQRAASEDVTRLAEEGVFHRLFAPVAPHTVSARGRSCRSCHNDPLALGLGRGTLTLRTDSAAYWDFNPAFTALRDGLPADAWTPFLGDTPGPSATRLDARPFSRLEQQRILRVGACLTCHDPDPANERRIYSRFDEALMQRSAACRVTEGD